MSEDPARIWYGIASDPPPLGVVVRVIWGGREPFEAARIRHPRHGRTAWLTHDKGRPVLLPTDAGPPDPRRPWVGWHTLPGTAPDYWQPLHPEKWQVPLPAAPAHVSTPASPGRMWSRTSGCGPGQSALDQVARVGIDGMSAAELAREMEDMREAAGASGRLAAGEPEAPDQQWWLDPHAVTYSAPGAIGMREAEGRLMRAFAAEWWVRVEWPRLKTSAQVLDQWAKALPPSPGEAAAQDPLPVRLEPTGRDRDDMLTALAWLRVLPRVTWRAVGTVRIGGGRVAVVRRNNGALGNPLNRGAEVLRLRAGTPPLTWRRIGDAIGRSDEAARQIYRAALAEVTAAANGGETPEVETVRAERREERARLDDLKRRTRQAKGA